MPSPCRNRRTVVAMGYNPYRKYVRRKSDFVFLGAAIAASVALVVWALFA